MQTMLLLGELGACSVKLVILRLNLEAVLTENYGVVNIVLATCTVSKDEHWQVAIHGGWLPAPSTPGSGLRKLNRNDRNVGFQLHLKL